MIVCVRKIVHPSLGVNFTKPQVIIFNFNSRVGIHALVFWVSNVLFCYLTKWNMRLLYKEDFFQQMKCNFTQFRYSMQQCWMASFLQKFVTKHVRRYIFQWFYFKLNCNFFFNRTLPYNFHKLYLLIYLWKNYRKKIW